MKTRILIIATAACLLAATAMAGLGDKIAISSGEQASSGAVYAGPGAITAVQVITDGGNNGVVKIYDNASAASGKVICEITVAGADHFGGRVWILPAYFSNGIYVSIAGTDATYIVEYLKE